MFIGKDFDITDNYCDYNAAAAKYPSKPLRFCTLFDQKKCAGPYKATQITNSRNTEFKRDVAKHAEALAKLKAAASSAPTSEKAKVKTAVVEAIADVQAARTNRAREKAKEALAKKKADRAVHMD